MAQTRLRWRLGFSRDLGIDLGTTNTLVYARGRGIVLREPSVVAYDVHTQTILAVGKAAQEMLGRTPASIVAVRPLKGGAIADFETTRKMLAYFITRVVGRNPVTRPRVVLNIPLGTTQVEKRAVVEAARQAGATEVFLVEEPLAAAMGAGLAVEEPEGNFVVNIGGGTTEVAAIALGGVVWGKSVRSAGDTMDQTIQTYLRKQYRLEIGARTAEKLKIELGYGTDPPGNTSIEARGINLRTGLPDTLAVSAEEISKSIQDPIDILVASVKAVFEKTPPQLASDIIERGIILTGGGAMLKHLDRLITRELHLPVQIAEQPLECVVKGTGKIVQNLASLSRLALYRA